ILAVPPARAALLGMATFRGLVTAATGALVATTLRHVGAGQGGSAVVAELLPLGLWMAAGAAVGSFLASLQGNPFRALGLVPVGATGLALGLAAAAAWSDPGPGLCVLVGVMAGLVNVPLATFYQ